MPAAAGTVGSKASAAAMIATTADKREHDALLDILRLAQGTLECTIQRLRDPRNVRAHTYTQTPNTQTPNTQTRGLWLRPVSIGGSGGQGPAEMPGAG